MSRGISWQQLEMLSSIASRTMRFSKTPYPVAWRMIDNGPSGNEGDPEFFTARCAWNREQTVRRALRSLRRRGLVELGRYVFRPEVVGASIAWIATGSDDHVAGETRVMVGAFLTPAGRGVIANYQAEMAKRITAEERRLARVAA